MASGDRTRGDRQTAPREQQCAGHTESAVAPEPSKTGPLHAASNAANPQADGGQQSTEFANNIAVVGAATRDGTADGGRRTGVDVRYDGHGTSAAADHLSPRDETTTSPRSKRRTRRPGPPLEVDVEIKYVTGPQADDLAQRQWAVFKEVLQWIATNQQTRSAPPEQGCER